MKAIARLAGYRNWQHASHVLGGSAQIGDDMGDLWYSHKCLGLLNIWCRNYEEALEQFDQRKGCFLFPYKSQFVVTNDDYVRALGFDTAYILLKSTNRNLVGIYSSADWDDLTFLRLQEVLGNASR